MADFDQKAATGVADTATKTGGAQPAKGNLAPLYDQLGEAKNSLKNAARFEKLPKLSDLVAEIDRLDGEVSNGIRVPGKGASKAEWDKYREGLGIPSSAEGYRLNRPDLPQGMRYNESLEKWFRGRMHQANVPQDVASAMFDEFNKMQLDSFAAMVASQKEAATKGMDALKAKFGDKLPDKMAAMTKAMNAFMSPGMFAKIKSVGLDNDPDFIAGWIAIGEKMSEDKLTTATEGGGVHEPRSGMPRTAHGHTIEYPGMRAKYPVRAE
jgi:hypothetical protein